MPSPLDTMYNNMKIEGRKIVGFGKYYGCTYEYVYTNDYKECKWCTTVNPTNFSFSDFQAYVQKINFIA